MNPHQANITLIDKCKSIDWLVYACNSDSIFVKIIWRKYSERREVIPNKYAQSKFCNQLE